MDAEMSHGEGRRVLVAGVGNVFLGDDGFGVAVAERLAGVPLPPSVRVADYGIRGVHLAYDILDDRPDTLIIIDALPLEEPPGTLAVMEVDDDGQEAVPAVDGHGLDPRSVLRLVRELGGRLNRVLVVGCRPAVLEESMGLSPAVAQAVDRAAGLVADLARAHAAQPAAPAQTAHRNGVTDA